MNRARSSSSASANRSASPASPSRRRPHSGSSMPAAAAGVRSAAGRSNSRSSTACTRVPRAVAGVGGSGMRSMTRNRKSSGQVMKSAARDGDSAEGGSPATPKEAPASRSSTAFSMSTPATVGQPTDVFLLSRGRPAQTASPQRQLWTCSKTPRRNARGPAARLDARSIDGVASGQEEQPDRREQTKRGQHGFVVARPFGIPVYVSPYWFIIAGVFSIIYANDLSSEISGNTRYVVAVAFVVLLYLSVLVHELSHSVVARGFGLPVRRIMLHPLGGVSEIEREAPTPGREFAVAGAGPALSLVLGGIGWGLAQGVPYGVTGALIRQLMGGNIIA